MKRSLKRRYNQEVHTNKSHHILTWLRLINDISNKTQTGRLVQAAGDQLLGSHREISARNCQPLVTLRLMPKNVVTSHNDDDY
jgi:hypothetical protein